MTTPDDSPSGDRSASGSADEEEINGKRTIRGVDRGAAACSECRRHKIRCHPAPEDPDHILPCKRCVKKGLSCEFLKHHRGRKKRTTQINAIITQPHPPLVDISEPPRNVLVEPPVPVRISRFPFLASTRTSNLRTHPDALVESESMSLRSMLDSNQYPNLYSNDLGFNNSAGLGDPVRNGLVSEEEGRALFNLFVLRFNGAMSLLDPEMDTYDHVRQTSSFLYTAILCIASRYLFNLPNVGHRPSESTHFAHEQIVALAREHRKQAIVDGTSNLDVIRAITFLSMWKEPDDDKAAFWFNRAVLLGKEMALNTTPARTDRMSPSEYQLLRTRQRVWLNLFMANTVFHLQFNQPIMIDHLDPLVVNCQHWLRGARPATLSMDTVLTCSIDLRRKCLHYRSLLDAESSSALALSVLTRTMNEDWETVFSGWENAILALNGGEEWSRKARVWASGLQLNLNLVIVNQSLRIPPAQRLEAVASYSPNLSAIPAFHHCLNAASSLLMRVSGMERVHVSYATDTLLHFSLYAATLLWTLCRTPQLYAFDAAETSHCQRLILKTAEVLSAASLYPSDSPALHANYLRRLCADPIPQESRQPTYIPEAPPVWHAPPPAMTSHDLQDTLSGAINMNDLAANFPWTGLEPPWNQLEGLWGDNTTGQWNQPWNGPI